MKLTKRKGFNFFRSYYDVYNELEKDSDKIQFIEALLNRQFLGVKPTNLKGMAKFAYISQTNSIDSQVKGYETKTGNALCQDPKQGATQDPKQTPKLQVEEKEKEKDTYRKFAHLSMSLEQFKKLEENYTKEQIDSVCDAIQNFKKNTNYKSLYLTAKNWQKKEQTKQELETSKGFKAPWD